MKKELVIHLGCYKTGSSSIQNGLYALRGELAEQGILYARSGLYHAEPDVGVRHTPMVYSYFEHHDAWQRQSDRLIEEISASRLERIVLSSEAWSMPVYVDSLEALVRKLTDRFELRTRGVVFFRNRLSYARSVYREFTHRRGNRALFRDFVSDRRRMFNYPQLMQRYLSILDAVEAVDFHRIGSADAEFFRRIGFQAPGNITRGRHNRGVSALAAEVSRVINTFGLTDSLDFREVTQGLVATAPSRFVGPFKELGAQEILSRHGNQPRRFRDLSGLPTSSCRRLHDIAEERECIDIAALAPEIEEYVADFASRRMDGAAQESR